MFTCTVTLEEASSTVDVNIKVMNDPPVSRGILTLYRTSDSPLVLYPSDLFVLADGVEYGYQWTVESECASPDNVITTDIFNLTTVFPACEYEVKLQITNYESAKVTVFMTDQEIIQVILLFSLDKIGIDTLHIFFS